MLMQATKLAMFSKISTGIVILALWILPVSAFAADTAAGGKISDKTVEIEIPTQDGVINTADLRGQVV